MFWYSERQLANHCKLETMDYKPNSTFGQRLDPRKLERQRVDRTKPTQLYKASKLTPEWKRAREDDKLLQVKPQRAVWTMLEDLGSRSDEHDVARCKRPSGDARGSLQRLGRGESRLVPEQANLRGHFRQEGRDSKNICRACGLESQILRQ